jgi:hypothetical protein
MMSFFAAVLPAADKPDLKAVLAHPIIGPHLGLTEVQHYTEPRIPRMPAVGSVAEWEQLANKMRAQVLERVVYRGQAAAWRDAKCKVEWLGTIKGGPGYQIKKLRFEAVPGLWIPALLYEPDKLDGKVPAILNVNGHDANGKAANYKQIRCINQAKRGMLALNVEWLNMGQLRGEGFHHGRMNQLDLCGTSGLAPFYLSMKRSLDILLALEHADPERVAVTGLSGGGWQTITISSLDTRVKLTDPVAGYSGFAIRVIHHKDLGDSEQTPTDLATVADYTHLTAMMAPRPTLLTYNSKDDCCFEAGYALPPLLEAARPIFKLYGRDNALRSHVNDNPGTHNYERDNREALYRMLGDFFYAGDSGYDAKEIPTTGEVKTKNELAVALPSPNADFHTLALGLSKSLPRAGALPTEAEAASRWQAASRQKLREIVSAKDYPVKAEQAGSEVKDGVHVTYWKLRLGDAWTVPAAELVRGTPKSTAILVNDAGRGADPVNAARLLTGGQRVLAVDPFYFGESKLEKSDYLFALLISAIGDRPLGIQASQLAAVARWSEKTFNYGPAMLVAVGPRLSLAALVAAGLEPKAIASLELHGSLGSLKEVIEQNKSVEAMPELFCFGLLEALDVKQLVALAAPRRVSCVSASTRAKSELADLKAWYTLMGTEFDPLR